jgi:hypothetical protein
MRCRLVCREEIQSSMVMNHSMRVFLRSHPAGHSPAMEAAVEYDQEKVHMYE